jgi:hypothetical protein
MDVCGQHCIDFKLFGGIFKCIRNACMFKVVREKTNIIYQLEY